MTMHVHRAMDSGGLGGGIGHSRPPLQVYDANNWLRRRFEAGASVRVCLAEIRVFPGAVVFDGPGGLKRRRRIYPDYKVSRNPLASDMVKQFELVQRALTCLPVPCVRVPGWEADDVIATLVRGVAGPVHIKSTDADFLQLPQVTIDRDKPFPAEQKFIRTYKATVGDKSDNIPGIRGFGEKAWASLSDQCRGELSFFLAGPELNDIPSGLPKVAENWLLDEDNRRRARSFYKITGLYDVPMSEIAAGTVIGQDDPDGLEIILKEYLL